MPESSKYKRVIFKKGGQTAFLQTVHELSGLSFTELAKASKVTSRHFLQLRRERNSIPLSILRTLAKLARIPIPRDVTVVGRYDHTKKAGKKGWQSTINKYKKMPVDEKKRKTGWENWWQTTGKNNPNKILVRKEIALPKRSADFAELCGILIGDGGISKYQMMITLNGETDKEYSRYVVALLKKLFKIDAKIYKIKNSKAINVSISRSNLVDFLVAQGMKLGHKINQNVSIPEWIMASKQYRIACFRGMVDTDGSVVLETHTIKGKKYVYPRLNFTSASPILVSQSCLLLSELDFHPKVRRGGRSVQLENLSEICQYFKVVGSSNQKHTRRIARWY